MKSYVVVLLLVVGILGGFYGGYKIGQNNVSASTATNNTGATRGTGGSTFGGGTGGGRGGFGGACPSPGAPSPSPGTNAVARGTITDLATGSMTITSTQCDVKVVFGNTVSVFKTVAGNTSDLKNNVTVTIVGTRQPDGSIRATTISIGGGGAGFIGGAPASPGAGG